MKHTVFVIHLVGRWENFHRKHMLLALAEGLPPGCTVLCVDRPVTLDITWWHDPRRFVRHVWRSTCRQVATRMWLATVRVPVHDQTIASLSWFSTPNRVLLQRQIARFVHSLASPPSRVIQWIYRPEQAWILDKAESTDSVYECYDEYARTPEGKLIPRIWDQEKLLLKRVTQTFVTAKQLLDTRCEFATRIHRVPNGVPSGFLESPRSCSDSIDNVPHPRIGYIGAIRRPMDFELLQRVFANRRDWHLLLIGPEAGNPNTTALTSLPNVHCFGSRPFESLPAIMRKLDVGLIPHAINDFSRALRPLKLIEYLSAGLPVVATQLPELEEFDEFVQIADAQADAFTAAIERALAMDRREFMSRAQSCASEFTWDKIIGRDYVPELREAFSI